MTEKTGFQKKHVTEFLTAYLHGEISEPKRHDVDRHLLGCSSCREEYEAVRIAAEWASQLPRVQAPDDLWALVESSLENRPQARLRFNLGAIAAGLLVALALTGSWFLFQPPSQSWQVTYLEPGEGAAKSTARSSASQLSEGEWLTTGHRGRAQIEFPSVGQVDLGSSTRVRLDQSSAGEQRLFLERGKIHARIWAPPGLFFVKTPSALAVDLGCAYSLDIDEKGEGLLEVSSGWVALERNRKNMLVPTGASCRIYPSGPGLPFFPESSAEFRSELLELERTGADAQSVPRLLAAAGAKDIWTVWHLLYEVDEAERLKISEWMTSRVAPPAAVTRDVILGLEPELETWRDRIAEKVLGSTFRSKKMASGSVAPVGRMQVARAGHSSTALQDGRVLIAGGWQEGEVTTAAAELYYPKGNKFIRIADMSSPRSHHTAVLLDGGRIWIAGGSDGGHDALRSTELFDPQRLSFAAGPELIEPRQGHRATRLQDGRVLITGGLSAGGAPLARAEIFDPASGQLRQVGALTTPREGHTATLLLDGRVLIVGGTARSGVSDAEWFDPRMGTFKALDSPMVSRRYKHGAALLKNGQVLIVGGWVDSGRNNIALAGSELFDPLSLKFSAAPDLNAPRYKLMDAMILLSDGRVLIAGGSDQLEIYDPQVQKFERAGGGLGTPRFYATATRLRNNQVLILGGYSAGMQPTSDAWIFNP